MAYPQDTPYFSPPLKAEFKVITLKGSYNLITRSDFPVTLPVYLPCIMREMDRLVLVDNFTGIVIGYTRDRITFLKPGWKNITIDSMRFVPGNYVIALKRLKFPFNNPSNSDLSILADIRGLTRLEPIRCSSDYINNASSDNRLWRYTWLSIKSAVKKQFNDAFFRIVTRKIKPQFILPLLDHESRTGNLFRRFWCSWKPLMTNYFEELYLPRCIVMGRKQKNSHLLRRAFEVSFLDEEQAKKLILLIMQDHDRYNDLLLDRKRPENLDVAVINCIRFSSMKSLPHFYLEEFERHIFHDIPKTYIMVTNLSSYEPPNYDGSLFPDERLQTLLPSHEGLPLSTFDAHVKLQVDMDKAHQVEKMEAHHAQNEVNIEGDNEDPDEALQDDDSSSDDSSNFSDIMSEDELNALYDSTDDEANTYMFEVNLKEDPLKVDDEDFALRLDRYFKDWFINYDHSDPELEQVVRRILQDYADPHLAEQEEQDELQEEEDVEEEEDFEPELDQSVPEEDPEEEEEVPEVDEEAPAANEGQYDEVGHRILAIQGFDVYQIREFEPPREPRFVRVIDLLIGVGSHLFNRIFRWIFGRRQAIEVVHEPIEAIEEPIAEPIAEHIAEPIEEHIEEPEDNENYFSMEEYESDEDDTDEEDSSEDDNGDEDSSDDDNGDEDSSDDDDDDDSNDRASQNHQQASGEENNAEHQGEDDQEDQNPGNEEGNPEGGQSNGSASNAATPNSQDSNILFLESLESCGSSDEDYSDESYRGYDSDLSDFGYDDVEMVAEIDYELEKKYDARNHETFGNLFIY